MKPRQLWVSSLYGVESDEPLVQISFDGRIAQMTPDEAREVAANLMDCASASEIDAVLYRFGREQIGDANVGAQLVELLRKFRGHYKGGDDDE